MQSNLSEEMHPSKAATDDGWMDGRIEELRTNKQGGGRGQSNPIQSRRVRSGRGPHSSPVHQTDDREGNGGERRCGGAPTDSAAREGSPGGRVVQGRRRPAEAGVGKSRRPPPSPHELDPNPPLPRPHSPPLRGRVWFSAPSRPLGDDELPAGRREGREESEFGWGVPC